jgi:hypothetical protein
VSRLAGKCAIAAVLGAAAVNAGCGERRSPPPEAPYAVAPVILPPVLEATPVEDAGPAPDAAALADQLGLPPPAESTSTRGRSFDADSGTFRAPASYAVLVARDGNGFVGSRAALPNPMRACIPAGRAVLRLHAAVGADGGVAVAIDEQEGLDATAIACVVEKLQRDPKYRPAPNEEPIGFEVLVR